MNPILECFSRRGLPAASAPFDQVQMKPVEGAKTVLITALPYWFETESGQNLARFAALPDYHKYFGAILSEIAEELKSLCPGCFFLPFTDNSPIDEQKAAYLSGLGVKGKNNLCITEMGSFVFLGEIITDGEISLPCTPPKRRCGDCGKCIAACPNGALTEEGFRYERCLAWITQKKGTLTEEESAALKRNRMAWGCDRCSEVCPHNAGLPTAAIALPPNTLKRTITRAEIQGLSDREFRTRYADRAFAWRGKATMLRNLNLLEGIYYGEEKE